MKIDHAVDRLVELVLEGNPVLERADITPDVEVTSGLNAGEDASWAHVGILARLVEVCNARRSLASLPP